MEISLENLHVDIGVLRVKNTHYSSIDLLVSTVHVSGFSLRFQVALASYPAGSSNTPMHAPCVLRRPG